MTPPPAPPPGPAMVAALRDLRPVRTRAPAVALALLFAAAAVVPLQSILRHGTRKDLPYLPLAWVAGMSLIWAGVTALLFARAVLPARGQVLPDAARAARTTVVATATMVALGLGLTMDAPGHTLVLPRERFAQAWWHCVSFELAAIVPLALVAALALRRVMPIGAGRIGATVAAAGAALSALTLQFVCPYGGPLHAALAHAGGVAIAALVGSVVLRPALRA